MNMFAGTDYPLSPHLWLEFSGGSESSVAGDLETAREIAEAEGCEVFHAETDATARAKLWEVRHNSLLAAMARAPGRRAYATDVCVPVSQLPDAFRVGRKLLEECGLAGGIVGHVGDGNYHIGFLLDPDDVAGVCTVYPPAGGYVAGPQTVDIVTPPLAGCALAAAAKPGNKAGMLCAALLLGALSVRTRSRRRRAYRCRVRRA